MLKQKTIIASPGINNLLDEDYYSCGLDYTGPLPFTRTVSNACYSV
ncbi:hypothetical protein NTGZN8_190011 [Candidatus Nitrotoga fabula]|uniref:Uncharacterized protein n=1 Tax=Candidatus Nitrotoga fabula TaxID=2182327 RepID=A0A916BBU9_9PROT|nr:hypothetical protein NTGZN8_190011 [Candidatus Nitrotoga fabula]